MRKNRFGAIAAMAAVAALTLTACGGSDNAGDEGGDKVRIGIKFDQPGLGFQDGSSYTGFDVDVAK